MPDFQLSYSGEQVNTAIGNGLNAVTTESGQTLTPDQQQVVQRKIGLNQLFSHTAPPIVEDKSGSMVSITDASNQTAVLLVSQIVPVQAGSGDPSPTNVRAISGWDVVKVIRTGANLYGGGDIAFTGTKLYTYPIKLPPGTYTLSAEVTSEVTASTESRANFYGANADGTNVYANLTRGARASKTINPTGFIDRTIFYSGSTTTNSAGLSAEWKNIQLEVGSAATPYEPYNAQTMTADLPETIYGGSLDWTTGVLTVDSEYLTLTGNEEIGLSGTSSIYFNAIMKEALNKANGYCSHAVVGQTVEAEGEMMLGRASTNYPNGTKSIYWWKILSTLGITTVDEFRNWLREQATAGKPVMIVYPLVTPYTIQLTPQQITLLNGTNNVWSNSGDTTISYVADTKMYIDGLVSSIASAVLNN